MDAWKPEEDRGGDRELKPTPPLASSSSSCSKRSRLPVQKRVVSVTVGSKPLHAGEAFPPSDSWSWRKYGQKPIKGSPYPRSYYRCSSCKGCPARKQVECSRLDPTKLIVTYSFDHNHLCPLPRNGSHHQNRLPPPAPPPIEEPAPPAQSGFRPLESTPEQEAKYPVVIGKNERCSWSTAAASHGSPTWLLLPLPRLAPTSCSTAPSISVATRPRDRWRRRGRLGWGRSRCSRGWGSCRSTQWCSAGD
ncbi:unnamed protein product [Musa hybrid cultivar]